MEPIVEEVEALDAIRRVCAYLEKETGKPKKPGTRSAFESTVRQMCQDLLEAANIDQNCQGCPLCRS